MRIPTPTIIEPGMHPCSELADYLAFVVARYHFDTARGAAITYPVEDVGLIIWAEFDDVGNLGVHPAVGYPGPPVVPPRAAASSRP